MSIGVVVALSRESATLGQGTVAVGETRRAGVLRIAVAGMGRVAARAAAERLVAAGVSGLVSWGVAGGLRPDLRSGALVLADAVMDEDVRWPVDARWRQRASEALAQRRARFTVAPVVCAAAAVLDPARKRALGATGAAAVDMESLGVVQAARQGGVPLLVVKAVCDPLERRLSPRLDRLVAADGRVRWLALAGALAHGPAVWRALFLLRADFASACLTLSRTARELPWS